jgi:hypothetical protein
MPEPGSRRILCAEVLFMHGEQTLLGNNSVGVNGSVPDYLQVIERIKIVVYYNRRIPGSKILEISRRLGCFA